MNPLLAAIFKMANIEIQDGQSHIYELNHTFGHNFTQKVDRNMILYQIISHFCRGRFNNELAELCYHTGAAGPRCVITLLSQLK
jgi:hypothetical protein